MRIKILMDSEELAEAIACARSAASSNNNATKELWTKHLGRLLDAQAKRAALIWCGDDPKPEAKQ